MSAPLMTVDQVKEARRRAWAGEPVRRIATDMAHSCWVVRAAVTGRTWSSIVDPPPVPPGWLYEYRRRQQPKERVCVNCRQPYKYHPRREKKGRCGACDSYLRARGTERPERIYLWQRLQNRIAPDELMELYRQYQTGVSVEKLAQSLPVSAAVLYQRFHKAGLKLRGPAETRQVLTAAKVLQARRLVHLEGKRVSDLAACYGVKYSTLHAAVMGITWHDAGGPVPAKDGEKTPCKKCTLLTGHSSGLCRYCR